MLINLLLLKLSKHIKEKKKLNFDINNFKKFKNKIEYIVQEDLDKDEFKLPDTFHRGFSKDFIRENSQRNYIMHYKEWLI
jgi:hypothetical protein